MSQQNPILHWLLTALWIGCLLLAFAGCKQQQLPILPTNYAQRDSVRIEIQHDSVYIDRCHSIYTKGDTVYIHDSIFRDRWKYKHDSIYFASTDTIYQQVVVEKTGSQFLRNSGIALWVLLGLLLLAVIVGIVLKFAK